MLKGADAPQSELPTPICLLLYSQEAKTPTPTSKKWLKETYSGK